MNSPSLARLKAKATGAVHDHRSLHIGQSEAQAILDLVTENERLRVALRPLFSAADVYASVIRNFEITGDTWADRRHSEGERDSTALERAYEDLASITSEQLCAVLTLSPESKPE